ncbi:hypothetical protein ACS3SW_18775 [Roseobacteraceae bacterium S113]
MKNQTVFGLSAPASRPTKTAAAIIALAIALPVGAILALGDWMFF